VDNAGDASRHLDELFALGAGDLADRLALPTFTTSDHDEDDEGRPRRRSSSHTSLGWRSKVAAET
jgi:hypothetical protein